LNVRSDLFHFMLVVIKAILYEGAVALRASVNFRCTTSCLTKSTTNPQLIEQVEFDFTGGSWRIECREKNYSLRINVDVI